ncbi:MAG: DUF3237 family protein [Verrucomicrobiota bacterium]
MLKKLATVVFAIAAWLILAQVPGTRAIAQLSDDRTSGSDKVLVPSKAWPCGMPEGIPVPECGVPVLEVNLQLGQVYDLGKTPFGHRNVFVVREGTVKGGKIHGSVMPGGLLLELSFSNAAMEVEQVLVIRTLDEKFIYVRSLGTAADPSDVRIVPDFEAPFASDYGWLNTGRYAGRRELDLAGKTMKLTIFDISGSAAASDRTNAVQVLKPAGLKDQPLDGRRPAAGEVRRGELITENVTLGAGQYVGATKNGGRNIIPITGGTLSGKITGKVLAGGADYQKLADPMTLDARYLWQTDGGDVVIVRNTGTINSLVPRFEVGLDSKYAWLNSGTYLSSSPRIGDGAVTLTFHESAVEKAP